MLVGVGDVVVGELLEGYVCVVYFVLFCVDVFVFFLFECVEEIIEVLVVVVELVELYVFV